MSLPISNLVTTDTRRTIQKLRRRQLVKILKAHQIDFNPDAAHPILVSVVESHGIDVTKPLPSGEEMTRKQLVEQEGGRQIVVDQPIEDERPAYYTAEQHAAIMARLIEQNETEFKTEKDELLERIEKLEQLLQMQVTPLDGLKRSELFAECKERGIETNKKDTNEDLRRKLAE